MEDQKSCTTNKASCCADVKDKLIDLPDTLTKLYQQADVKNGNEALVVALNVLMLECDFVPKGEMHEKRFDCLPGKWQHNIYTAQYYHISCQDVTLLMTCVPLEDFIAVHGTLEIESPNNAVSVVLKTRTYISHYCAFSDARSVYHHLVELSQFFKDGFVLAAIAEIQDVSGIVSTLGFAALTPDMKFFILLSLPLNNLVAMSSVNKEFYEIAKSNFLWKHLFLRDFASVAPSNTADSHQWKELYMKEYALEVARRRPSQNKRSSEHMGSYLPLPDAPYFISPFRRNDWRSSLPPEIVSHFPQLARRYRLDYPYILGISSDPMSFI